MVIYSHLSPTFPYSLMRHAGERRVDACRINRYYVTTLLLHILYILLHTQRQTLRHGTTTGAYNAPSTQESNREFVRVVGKFSMIMYVKYQQKSEQIKKLAKTHTSFPFVTYSILLQVMESWVIQIKLEIISEDIPHNIFWYICGTKWILRCCLTVFSKVVSCLVHIY